MKSTILLTLAAGLLCHTVYAQNARPKKGDNVVLIQTPDSASMALKKVGQAFVAQGYTVERMDAQLLTLTLAPKVLANRYSPTVVARAIVSGEVSSQIKISADYRGLYGTIPLIGIAEFKGSENGANILVFRAIEKVALAYPNGRVNYSKQ